MIQVRYSIISLHWRKKHILGLSTITILILSIHFFLDMIALGEGEYINNQFSKNIIEIIGLIFVIYFASSTWHTFLQSKILYLFWSKKQNASNIIGGIVSAILTIIIIYTSISYIFVSYTGGFSQEHFTSRIGTILVLSIMTLITIALSLVSNSYISFMAGTIIYFISYSTNFILISIQYQETGKVFSSLLYAIQFLLPRFDLLTSPLLPINSKIWAIGGHSILLIVLYYVVVRLFSSRYIYHENFFHIGHKTKSK